jgi:1,2-phenylacetyl-CoA epoxidase PaaB subunit
VGEVEAASADEAMQRALESFERRDVLVWWVFPAREVAHSGPEDVEVYRIAETKRFRAQGEYHTVAALRKLREREQSDGR